MYLVKSWVPSSSLLISTGFCILKSGPVYYCYQDWAETNVKNLLLHRTFTEDKVLMFLQIRRSLSLLSIEINIYFYIKYWRLKAPEIQTIPLTKQLNVQLSFLTYLFVPKQSPAINRRQFQS